MLWAKTERKTTKLKKAGSKQRERSEASFAPSNTEIRKEQPKNKHNVELPEWYWV